MIYFKGKGCLEVALSSYSPQSSACVQRKVLRRSLWIPLDEGWMSSSGQIRRIIRDFLKHKTGFQYEMCEWSSRAWPCVFPCLFGPEPVALGPRVKMRVVGWGKSLPPYFGIACRAPWEMLVLCNLFCVLSHGLWVCLVWRIKPNRHH